eukprot:gene13815-12662_t
MPRCGEPPAAPAPGAGGHMRWVHVDTTLDLGCIEPDFLAQQGTLVMLRLMAKYGLHPLAVEDALDDTTGTKADTFGGQLA